MTDLAAVVHACEQAFTAYLKVDEVIRVRNKRAVLVYDLDCNKGEITAICLYGSAIGNQDDFGRLRRSSHLFSQQYFAVLTRYSFQCAGLVRNAPNGMQLVAGLSLLAQRLAIEEQLHLVAVVIGPHIHSVTLLPVPMRKDVQDGLVGPLALVHVESIFGKAGQIDDAEVRAARRPGIRCRLADVIPTGPDKLTGKEIVLLYNLPGLFLS